MGDVAIKAIDAESYLKGKQAKPVAVTEASRLAAAATEPTADRRGTVEYKREMARVLTERALRLAIQRAGGTI
jgi:carbon-monoxide dehydrogenase medium subunit